MRSPLGQSNSGALTLTFSAPLKAWRLVADQWYGGRSAPFDMDVHKAAEKLMADIDDAIRDGLRAVSEIQEFE